MDRPRGYKMVRCLFRFFVAKPHWGRTNIMANWLVPFLNCPPLPIPSKYTFQYLKPPEKKAFVHNPRQPNKYSCNVVSVNQGCMTAMTTVNPGLLWTLFSKPLKTTQVIIKTSDPLTTEVFEYEVSETKICMGHWPSLTAGCLFLCYPWLG